MPVPPPLPPRDSDPPLRPSLTTLVQRWGKIAGAVGGILGLIGLAGSGVLWAINLHDTILANKAAVEEASAANLEEHRELRHAINGLVEATRQAREQDRQVMTNLRIAVAAIQASQRVRSGEIGYAGVTGLGAGDAPPDPLASVRLDPEPPVRRRDREAQAAHADRDALRAIENAAAIQEEQLTADPLSGL